MEQQNTYITSSCKGAVKIDPTEQGHAVSRANVQHNQKILCDNLSQKEQTLARQTIER